jgi:DNA-binding NtrC family response regulator
MAILIVDDDPETRARLDRALRQSGDGWDVREAATATEGLALASAPDVECVLLDYRLPDADGLTCLRELRRARPELPVVMVTGSGSEAVAVQAMKLGAADYVVKHATYVQVVPGLVREALGRRALARLATDSSGRGGTPRGLPALDPPTRARFDAVGLVARSPAMLRVLALVARAAQSKVTVLIEGESGTGKDLCARALHDLGPRASRPFLAQNCAAVPEPLLESELFGHARGAFTGADRARPGLFEQADGGTLFLDEIGEASAAVQAKLLRVLQDREIRPVGATSARRLDVRVVSATNRDLRRDITEQRFRRDLLYRLSVFPIFVPPLRERREDIAPLAERFLEKCAREEAKPLAGFDPETLALMERHAWPGNVRELQHEVHRLVLCAEPEERIAPDALAPWVTENLTALPASAAPLREIMRQVETVIVQSRLREHGYRRGDTARSLGITREALWAKLRALGLTAPAPDDPT